MDDVRNLGEIECGKEARKQFAIEDGYRHLNHGSFGTYPLILRPLLRHFQERAESRTDSFIGFEFLTHLNKSRKAIEQYLHAAPDTCVLVANATTGVNTVLRNLVFKPGDVIVYFDTIYGACGATVTYICETTPAESRKVHYTYPISDDSLCEAFENVVADIRAEGKDPKVAIFDTIVSLPGVRMPFERLTKLCKQQSILSLIDGAHGVGHISLDLSELDPDFFISNCHKWLYVPRGCAVFYVPQRNQRLIRSTLPTSHGFVPRPAGPEDDETPIASSESKAYLSNFAFIGTMDSTPYLCIPAAIEWRKHITWDGKKGEDAIFAYNANLAREAGKLVAGIWQTEELENEEGTLGKCNFAMVRAPVDLAKATAGGVQADAVKVAKWMTWVLSEEHQTAVRMAVYAGSIWIRFSAQVYLTLEDFEEGAQIAKKVCERAERGDWKSDARSEGIL